MQRCYTCLPPSYCRLPSIHLRSVSSLFTSMRSTLSKSCNNLRTPTPQPRNATSYRRTTSQLSPNLWLRADLFMLTRTHNNPIPLPLHPRRNGRQLSTSSHNLYDTSVSLASLPRPLTAKTDGKPKQQIHRAGQTPPKRRRKEENELTNLTLDNQHLARRRRSQIRDRQHPTNTAEDPKARSRDRCQRQRGADVVDGGCGAAVQVPGVVGPIGRVCEFVDGGAGAGVGAGARGGGDEG